MLTIHQHLSDGSFVLSVIVKVVLAHDADSYSVYFIAVIPGCSAGLPPLPAHTKI